MPATRRFVWALYLHPAPPAPRRPLQTRTRAPSGRCHAAAWPRRAPSAGARAGRAQPAGVTPRGGTTVLHVAAQCMCIEACLPAAYPAGRGIGTPLAHPGGLLQATGHAGAFTAPALAHHRLGARTTRRHSAASAHLVASPRVDAQPHVQLHSFIKLGPSQRLHRLDGLLQAARQPGSAWQGKVALHIMALHWPASSCARA